MQLLIARGLKTGVVFFLFLLTAVTLPLSTTSAQPAQNSGTTAQESTEFLPPAFLYSSVFENYHGYQDQEVASWLEANETVGRIGGWRYYLEEAYPSDQHPVTQPEDTLHHSGHGGKP
jgi:hypothetical protein